MRNGEGNTKLSQRLSAQFSGRVETMGLVTGEAADYRTTTTGMEAEIIRDDDKILATASAPCINRSWTAFPTRRFSGRRCI